VAWTKVGQTTATLPIDGEPHDVTLPGTPAQNDIVLVAFGSDGDGDIAISTSNYSTIATATNDWALAYKILGASPDTVVTLTSGWAKVGAVLVQVWRGVDTTTPLDGVTATTASGSSGMPDAAAISPNTSGALCFAFGYLDDDDAAASVTAPSGYSNLVAADTGQASTTAGATVVLASKEITTTDNPAAFGGTGSDAWAARTFVLKPGGGSSISGTLTATLGDLTSVAAGTVRITGTASVTLGALTSAASGGIAIAGTASPTLEALTSTATGTVSIDGSSTATLDAATVVAAGTVGYAPINGALAVTLGAATTVATGTVTAPGTVADDFERADGGLGTNWTQALANALTISGGAAIGGSGERGAVWNADDFADDQFSQITLRTWHTGWIGAFVRRPLTGDPGGYLAIYYNGNIILYARSTSWHQRATVAQACAAGDTLRLVATGSSPVALTVYHNGVEKISHSESSYLYTGGQPGLAMYAPGSGAVEWWSGGDIENAPLSGTLAQTLGALSATATGTVGIAGTLTATLGAATTTAAGTVAIAGSASPTLGGLTGTATGTVAISGSAAPTLGAATLSAAGTVVSGKGIITRLRQDRRPGRRYAAGAFAGKGATSTGTLGVTLGTLTASAAGTVAITGTAAPTLAALTATAAGTVSISGSAAPTLGTLTVTATGTLPVTGTSSITLGALTLSATGAVGEVPLMGELAATLGALTISASGTVRVSGAGSITLALLTLTATGATGPVPISGDLAATLAALTATGAGTVAIVGSTDALLAALTCEAVGTVLVAGSLDVTLGALTLEASDLAVVLLIRLINEAAGIPTIRNETVGIATITNDAAEVSA
jgi:hypothetical protein